MHGQTQIKFTMNNVTWNVIPCNLIKIYKHFQRNSLPPSLAQKMEATGTSKTGKFVTDYKVSHL